MDRHAFLAGQDWLAPAADGSSAGQAAAPARPATVTAFVGGASFHVSPSEQYTQGQRQHQYAGPLAPDAVHLAFSTTAPGQDPMQLRLHINISLHPAAAAASSSTDQQQQQQQHMQLALQLDGCGYLLLLRQAVRLVLPQQLLPLLPPALQQGLAGSPMQQPDAGAQRVAGQQQTEQQQTEQQQFVAVAPESTLPFLTLVFPHTCLNIYPLGWKAAAAHISKEHDAAELARLAQLLIECWQQQRLLAVPPPQSSLPVGAAGAAVAARQEGGQPADWWQGHQQLTSSLRIMAATIGKLAGSNAAGLAIAGQQDLCQQLAEAAAGAAQQRRAAAAALPAEHRASQAVQQQLADMLAGWPQAGAPGLLDQQFAEILLQQAQATACSLLAAA